MIRDNMVRNYFSIHDFSAKGHMWLIIFLFLSLLLTGWERNVGAQETGEKIGLDSVVVAGSQWYGHVPVWIGIERGIFKEYGFDVSWQYIGSSKDRLNAISSGQAQFASLGEIAMLCAMAQGNRRFYWVGNQDIAPGFEGMVVSAAINSFENLKGKKIGFPFVSSVDLTCHLLLRQHGLDPAKDVELVNLEVEKVTAAFKAGDVDAALAWEPWFTQLRMVDGARVLAMDTATEVYKSFGTMTGPDVLILEKAWVDANPDRARRFMTAYFIAVEWLKRHTDQAAQIVHGRYIKQVLALIRSNLNKITWHGAEENAKIMSDDGIFSQAEHVVDILHDQTKAISKKPNFRDWVNLDVLPARQIKQ